MATFTVNGKTVTADHNQKLIRFLRDELRLTSVKDGCSEGACGACTILVDGKAVRACVLTTDRADGKTILTAEEAMAIGLVNHVTEDTRQAVMNASEAMARKIMEKGPVAVALAKICINMGSNTDINTGLMLERMAQTIALSTEDRREGTAAFLEKRPAQFQGR